MKEKIDRNYLEIKSINALIESSEIKLKYSIELVKTDDFQINKFFYKNVGKKHRWKDRLIWSDNDWIKYISNSLKFGFGANHNKAFKYSFSDYFIVLNPDIRFKKTCLLSLISSFTLHPSIGVVAPAVYSSHDTLENSSRSFPTFSSLLRKLLKLEPQLKLPTNPISVDWVGGMFMMFKRDVFRKVNGFNSRRFFMYYEDVDLCHRIRNLGYDIIYDPSQSVIHDAQRASRHNFRHMKWHLTSMFRYLSGI